MDAQKIILRELNSEFGGSAEALGKTLPGQINIAKEQFNNLSAQLVQGLLPSMTAITAEAVKVTNWLTLHPKLAKQLTLALAALSAALLAARGAQVAMNIAAESNPYVATAIALGVLTAATIKYRKEIIGTVNNGVDFLNHHLYLLIGVPVVGWIAVAIVEIVKFRNQIADLARAFARLPGQIASGILGGAGAIKNAAVSLGTSLEHWLLSGLQSLPARIVALIKSAVNHVIDEINGALKVSFNTHIPGVGKVTFDAPDIPHLATGGFLAAGQTALVGERGPELFVAPRAGAVVPNGGLATAAMAPIIVQMNIDGQRWAQVMIDPLRRVAKLVENQNGRPAFGST
jgi:hypothetical protein